MNYKNFPCILPIRDNNVKVIDGIVQHDTANIVDIQLMEGTEPFDFTGYTEIYIEIDKPDGTHIQACVTDDATVNSNNPYSIQVVDAVNGRISFTLIGQATTLIGTHFAQIIVMGDGKRLTSARINYKVGATLSDDTDDALTSSSDYASLSTMLDRLSSMSTAERQRIDSETLRNLAETEREERVAELEAEVQAYLDTADSYVNQTQEYMEAAQGYAELAQNPSAEIMAGLISGLDLASETYVDTAVSNATETFDAGAYTDTDPKLLKLRRGNDDDIPELDLGEMGFSVDTDDVYIGGSNGNVCITGIYQASATAPTRTDVLWIDTSAGSVVKYHNGTAWTPTATAAFS